MRKSSTRPDASTEYVFEITAKTRIYKANLLENSSKGAKCAVWVIANQTALLGGDVRVGECFQRTIDDTNVTITGIPSKVLESVDQFSEIQRRIEYCANLANEIELFENIFDSDS